MAELIEWVEKQAQENLKFRLSCLESLLKESNIMLTMLLAGFGVTSAYIIKSWGGADFEKWLMLGLFGLSLYFLVLCGIVILKCMAIKEIQLPSNEPRNLYQKKFTLLQVREAELKNIQERIDRAAVRNSDIADWLNITRLLILASPVIFLMSSSLAFCF